MINQRIIEQIQKNNYDKALDTLYKTAYPSIRNYILRNSGDIEQVKDIFQESIIVLIESVRNNKYDAERDINAFLYAIAKNKWINTIRKNRSHAKYVDYSKFSHSPSEDSAHEILMNKEIRFAMNQVLLKLNEQCQKILEMHIYKGISMDEIALELGYNNRDVVKTMHYKCKKKLKEFIIESKTLKELFL